MVKGIGDADCKSAARFKAAEVIILAKSAGYGNAFACAWQPGGVRDPTGVKFHLSPFDGHVVTGSGPGWVRVGADEHRESFILAPDAIVKPWAEGGFEGLSEANFAAIQALSPEIALLGTGARQRFPHPRLYRALIDARIGVEIMDSAAAARTYNIIAAEGRRVVAGLMLP